MLKVNGTELTLTPGDSLLLTLRFSGRTLPEGTRAVFTVRTVPRAGSAVIEKTARVGADGTAVLALTSAETDLKPRSYCWDVRLFLPAEEEGLGPTEVITPMEPGILMIPEAVGRASAGLCLEAEGAD